MIAVALTYWRQAAAILLLTAAFAGGWTANGWRWQARQAEAEAAAYAAARLAQDSARQQSAAWAAEAAAADTRHITALREAQNEIDRLRADVAAGAVRLRVRAVCPAAAGVPGTPAASGVGDGAAPRLEGDAEQHYYTLLSQLSLMESQLRACQERP